MDSLQGICQEQFQLVYYGHFTYAETNELAVHEREMIYHMLVDQKHHEKEAYDKAVQEAKQKQSQSSSRSRRHR